MRYRGSGLGLVAVILAAAACGSSDLPPESDDSAGQDSENRPPDTVLPEPVQVVVNGGFEEGGDVPDAWSFDGHGMSYARVVSDSPEGDAHLEMSAGDEGSGSVVQSVVLTPGWPSTLRMVSAYTGLTQGSGMEVYGTDLSEGVPFFSNLLGDSDWVEVPGTQFVPSDTEYTVFDWLSNGQTVRLDDVQLLQWDPSKIAGYGAVSDLVGSAVYRIVGGVGFSGTGTIYHPLPALHQGQVPLAFRLTADTEGVVTSLAVTERWERDQVLAIGVSSASRANVTLEAIVLETELGDAGRLYDLARETSDPAIWLLPSEIVQSDDSGIAKAALEATASATTDEEKVEGVLIWLRRNMTGTDWPSSLDAKAVFDARMGSCTGYANLAAALGRAAGVPSRVVAGYPAWYSPLQTHYIDEFYLEGRGWVRYEPQSTQPGVPQHYMTVVSVVHPEQEGKEAMSAGRWSARGVPVLTLTEFDGDLRLYYPSYLFDVCPQCDHGAFGVFDVGLEHLARLDALAAAGAESWADFLDSFEAGNPWTYMDSTFAPVFEASDFEAMEAALE
jgi:transglutaminase-like putative cysteine protease